jgi:hypothetical protein
MQVSSRCPHCHVRAQLEAVPGGLARCPSCRELFTPLGTATAPAAAPAAEAPVEVLDPIYDDPEQAERAVRARVALPALGMALVALVSLCWNILVLSVGTSAPPDAGQAAQPADEAGRQQARIIFAVHGGLSAFVLFAGIQMFRLRQYGVARVGSILSVLPLLGPCCGLSIPFGIWGVVVLGKPEVRAAFR